MAAAGQATWVAGLTLALSSFMGWYSGSGPEGPTVSVLGWNTGTLGKFVFVLGIAIVLLAVRRGAGIELPKSLPESLIVIVLATTATFSCSSGSCRSPTSSPAPPIALSACG